MTVETNPWTIGYEDVRRLAGWAGVNSIAKDADERTATLVAAALDGRGPKRESWEPPLPLGTPLLLSGNPDRRAIPLLDAMLDAAKHPATHCHRCRGGSLRPGQASRLWILCGQSVVELVMCFFCRDVLNDICRTADHTPLLVWS